MLNIGDKIHSDRSGKTYTVTYVFKDKTNSEPGFADAGGGSYFIKRLLKPKYPLDDAPLSPAMKKSKRKECDDLFKKNSEVYEAVKKGCGEEGACVPILDYFREGSYYYTVYRKINADSLTIGQISELPKKEKYSLLLNLVYGLKPLYTLGIIHGDLKPENILVQRKEDKWRIRLIDIDDCYKAGHPNDPGFVLSTIDYNSPELAIYNNSEIEDREDPEEMARVRRMAADLTLKSDVFALGIIFCEFYGGEKPYSTEGKAYVYEAAAKGCLKLPASVTCDSEMSALIGGMLSKDYRSRPSLTQVENELKKMIMALNRPSVPKTESPKIKFAKPIIHYRFGTVSMESPQGINIYYSLDGSIPTIDSLKYTKPFELANTKEFHVRAICGNGDGVSDVEEIKRPTTGIIINFTTKK